MPPRHPTSFPSADMTRLVLQRSLRSASLDATISARPDFYVRALPNAAGRDLAKRFRKAGLFCELASALLAHRKHLGDLLEADQLHAIDPNACLGQDLGLDLTESRAEWPRRCANTPGPGRTWLEVRRDRAYA